MGTIVDIHTEGEVRKGRVRVAGAITQVDLTLLPDARPGDTVLAHAGVGMTVMLDASGEGELGR